MKPAVAISELFRVYQTPDGDAPALQGVSLSIARGEVLSVIGPSGSGKSTLLRVIAGVERPDAGTAFVLGEQPARMSPRALADFRRTRLGIVEQHAEQSVSPDASCRDAVALQLMLLGHHHTDARRVADGLLDKVGLGELTNRRVGSLSGGQRQRVAVAAAMAHRPELLLADEPTGELDAASAHAVYEAIRTLVVESGATAVIVSHDAAAATVADRSVTISDGRFSSEQHGGSSRNALVVGPGGWVRLPPELRAAAALGERAEAEATGDGITLRPIGAVVAGVPATRRTAPVGDRVPGAVVAELVAVTKSYGDEPLFPPLSAILRAGTLTAITGGSGSGKTTLLKILTGLVRPTTGTCRVDGTDLASLDTTELAALRRRAIAVVDQDVGLVPFLTARENVAFGLTLRERDEGDVEPWLIRLDLARRMDQRVERLSAGERQRVALARALAIAPELLLVDEPTSRLDRRNAEQVAHLLAEVTAEQQVCTVCATHDVAVEALAHARLRLS